MKYNAIIMYDTYTNVEFLYNNKEKYRNFTYHFVRGMFEKLARRLTRWHAKLKRWHPVQHFGTVARKNEKLARRWQADTF